MERDIVRIYKNDALANEALADYIMNNPVVDAREVTFSNDDWCHAFEYIGIPAREWEGWMNGIRVRSENGDVVVFSSWEDEDEKATDLINEIDFTALSLYIGIGIVLN